MGAQESNPGAPKKVETHSIYVVEESLSEMEQGLKNVEICTALGNPLKVKKGDILEFKASGKVFKARALDIRLHPTAESVLEKENLKKIFPDIEINSEGSLIVINLFKEKLIKKYGLVAIEFEKI